jgi:hypothetical protein
MSPEQKKTSVLMLLGLVACLGLALFVYWPGLSGPFMVDDGPNIENGFIENPDWDAAVYTITHNGSGILGRSVSMLSFVLSGLQFGLDPWGFKLHNLLLHLATGFALFHLLRQVLPKLDAQLDEKKVLLISGATVTLWLLHPLLVSTVMYVVQRMAMLSTLFTVLALLAWLDARSHLAGLRFYVSGWIVFPAMGLLAVLSKESAALIPVYLLVIELCCFRSEVHEARVQRRIRVLRATFIAIPIALALIAFALKFDEIIDYSMRTFTLSERVLTQVHVLFFYMRLILLPRISSMSLFHDDFPLTTQFDALTGVLALLLLGMLLLAWKLRRRWPVVSFGIFLFFASHLLESTFIPLELVFEHRNYLASIGLLLLPVYAIFKASDYRALRLLVPVFIIVFSLMTATRATEWGSRDMFHEVSVIEHPDSPRALNNYVNYLMGSGRYDAAISTLERLVELTPNDAGAFLHMQVTRCAKGEVDHATLQRAAEVAAEYPLQAYGHSALQVLTVMVVDGKCAGLTVDDVEPVLDAAFAYAERNEAFYNFHNLYHVRAAIAMKRGLYAQGYSDFRIAHEMTGQVSFLHELMKYQVSSGRLTDAAETLELMEQQNARRFGIETYVVKQSRSLLEGAGNGNEAALPAEEAVSVEPAESAFVR